MNQALSLDHLTIFEATPPELIRIAGGLGVGFVSLWTQKPLKGDFPLLDAANKAETRNALSETGVRLGNLECFNLTPEVAVEDFHPAVALGAELGARSLTAINAWDPEPARALDNFGRLCRMGAEYGLKVNVEFISMGQVRTPTDAVRLVMECGEPNAGITVDILHVIRSGGAVADLAVIGPNLIGYAQICDGPLALAQDQWNFEGFEQRAIPGEGEFPLGEFVDALPEGIVLGVEVPLKSLREAGVAPGERARLAVAGARRGIIG